MAIIMNPELCISFSVCICSEYNWWANKFRRQFEGFFSSQVNILLIILIEVWWICEHLPETTSTTEITVMTIRIPRGAGSVEGLGEDSDDWRINAASSVIIDWDREIRFVKDNCHSPPVYLLCNSAMETEKYKVNIYKERILKHPDRLIDHF